jgi:hypothetical protein
MRPASIHQICAKSYKTRRLELLRAAHRPIDLVPMRGNLFQRASGGQSRCLETLDDLFEFCKARLDGAELIPKAVQLPRENFALGVSGGHCGRPILPLANSE